MVMTVDRELTLEGMVVVQAVALELSVEMVAVLLVALVVLVRIIQVYLEQVLEDRLLVGLLVVVVVPPILEVQPEQEVKVVELPEEFPQMV